MHSVGTPSRVPAYSEKRKRCIGDGDRGSVRAACLLEKRAGIGDHIARQIRVPDDPRNGGDPLFDIRLVAGQPA
jgi:hypothetical protein